MPLVCCEAHDRAVCHDKALCIFRPRPGGQAAEAWRPTSASVFICISIMPMLLTELAHVELDDVLFLSCGIDGRAHGV